MHVEAEVNLRCYILGVILLFDTEASSETWGSMIRLGLLSASTRITVSHCTRLSMWVPGTGLRSSSLCDKHLLS